MAAVVGLVSYLLVTGLSLQSAWKRVRQMPAQASTQAEVPYDASWNFRNPELDQLITDLHREKEALALRQHQLHELAARLATERAELNQVVTNISLMQKEFDRNVVRIQEEEVANVKKLAKIYATMAPAAVSAMFKEMDDDKIVKVLLFLKEPEMATLLENMTKQGEAEAKRAVTLIERYRLSISRNTTAKTKTK
jgi:flagellar motility protein MotE (MotC chaperone)